MSNPEDPFHCPRCAGGLERIMGGLRCLRCGIAFPILGTLPCLVADAALWRTVWLRRLDDYTAGMEARLAGLREQSDGEPGATLSARTRGRLTRMAAGLEEQVEAVTGLFELLDAGANPLLSSLMPGGAEPGGRAAVLEGYEQLLRDWAWGASEVEQARDFVAPLLPRGLDRVAFFGSGAGRLAVELHHSRTPARTLAFELNPLAALVTSRLLGGETVTLPEFPIQPRSPEEVVVTRQLVSPFAAHQGFSLAIADPLRPPLRPGSLAAVVTAWFVDEVPVDPRQTAAIINRFLRPGGWWVNVGPLRFQGDLARAHGIDELLEIVGAGGFETSPHGPEDERDLPALNSPSSGSRRSELVFRFAAKKIGEAAAVALPDPVPPWVANPAVPIPITPGMVALGRSSMFTTGVLGMIDGSRSVLDVARELGRAWGVEPAQLHDELRAFLARIPG